MIRTAITVEGGKACMFNNGDVHTITDSMQSTPTCPVTIGTNILPFIVFKKKKHFSTSKANFKSNTS